MNRRTFLTRLGATGAGLALGAPALFADDPVPSLGRIAYQFSWIKNFQFAGEYIADYKKYFQRHGVEVDLLSGGPGMTVDAVIMAGKALIGQSHPDFMANAIAKGATVKCIGANYQRNVCAIVSMAKTALMTPKDLIGKKIGVQTGNLVDWHAFLRINKIDPVTVNTVPVQSDTTPLVSGEVDGFFGYANDDVVQMRESGHDIHPLLFADFGYKMFTATYSVATSSLTDKVKRAQLVAFMRGDIMGWQDAIKDPALGARLTVDVYAKSNGLNEKSEEASCRATNDFMVNDDTRQHGLFWMSPQSVQETIESLAAGGVKATPDMFTNEILEEAYAGKTTL